MRASRLVTLLLLLQTRGDMTAAQLADELEVSVRTVHRDVEALAEAGVPVYAERGPHGGIRLVDGYRTRLTGLNEDEAEAVFLSGMPGPAAELGLGTVVAAARLKVLAALPPELRSRASRLRQRFHLDAPGWFSSAEATPCLVDVATAVWEDRRLRMRYDRGDAEVERLLDPLGLVLKGGTWYAVGRVGEDVRTYRVSRIVHAEMTQERFERVDDFDLALWWAESTAAYERSAERVEVTLRVAPGREDVLLEVLGEATIARAEDVVADDPEGWRHIRVSLEWPRRARFRLLGLGSAAEVIEPLDLREAVVREARSVIERAEARSGVALSGPGPRTTP
jgi:predicted DNA-binding transcriptional regulator YafY